MNVALHSPAWPRSRFANGIVTAVELLAAPLRSSGIGVHVITWEGEIGPAEPFVHMIAEAPRARGLGRLRHGLQWGLDPRGANRRLAAARIQHALDELKSLGDVDVLELEEAFGLATHLTAGAAGAVVVTLHGPWFLHGPLQGDTVANRDLRDRVRAEGEALRKADLLLAPSRDVLRRTVRHYGLEGRPAVIVPYAMPARPLDQRWRLEDCDLDEVLFVGRFDRHKGGDLVIDAFARVAAESPRARLVFVGPDRGLIEASGRRWDLAEYVQERLPGALEAGRVELTGQLSPTEIERRRLRALVTLSCSRWENLSLAVLEAMAMGCPLVVADSGGVPEHVRDGETGLAFRTGDAEDLAGCILRLLRQPEHAAELGCRAALHVERELEPARVARMRVDAYRRALEARRGARTA